MAAVGDLVRCTNGAWMVRPPARGPSGHRPGPDRVLVGHPPCSCRGGPTSRECNAVVYAPGATFRLPPAKKPVHAVCRGRSAHIRGNATVAQVVQNALGSGSPAGAAKLDGAGCSPTLTLSKHSEGEEL